MLSQNLWCYNLFNKQLLYTTHIIQGSQTKKFSQLIEFNIRQIFLGRLYPKYGGGTIPRLFSKKSKLSISLDY